MAYFCEKIPPNPVVHIRKFGGLSSELLRLYAVGQLNNPANGLTRIKEDLLNCWRGDHLN